MLRAIIGLGLLAAAIAFGVKWAADEGTSKGPTQVDVEMPNPMGGGGGGDGGDAVIIVN